jgi:hypothetical protein
MSWNVAQEILANVSASSDVEKHKILTFYCTSNSVLDHTVCVLPAKGKRRSFFFSRERRSWLRLCMRPEVIEGGRYF